MHLRTPPARRLRPFFRQGHRGLLCVGRAWGGRASEGGPVAFGSTLSVAGHTEAGTVVKIHLDIITTLL